MAIALRVGHQFIRYIHERRLICGFKRLIQNTMLPIKLIVHVCYLGKVIFHLQKSRGHVSVH